MLTVFCLTGPECCTPQEALDYRNQLRIHGPERFIARTIEAGVISAKKLLTAFSVRPPDCFEGQPDQAYNSLVVLAISRELKKRAKLPQYNTVDDAVALLRKAQNIIVLTGAGISTSLGIPDFRSAGAGLYAKLEHLGLSDPQEVFNIEVFKEDPTIFFSVAKDILPETKRYTPTHAFIAMLQNKGKLLTNYSQNIDNVEAHAGISREKLVQWYVQSSRLMSTQKIVVTNETCVPHNSHGSFATATCIKCAHKVPGEAIFADIKASRLPYCPKCSVARRSTKNSRKRKLLRDGTEKKPRRRHGDYDSASDSEYDMPSKGGIMKPDITFFGEALPDEFARRLVEVDRQQTDLVVVIGTSLKVAPVSELVPFLPPHIPQIYISREPITHHNFDIDLIGDCDVVVAELCKRAGWNLEHDMIPEGQTIKVQNEPGWASRHVFTAHRPGGDPASDSGSLSPAISVLSSSDGDHTDGSYREAAVPTATLAAQLNGQVVSTPNTTDSPSGSSEAAVTVTRSGRHSRRASPK